MWCLFLLTERVEGTPFLNPPGLLLLLASLSLAMVASRYEAENPMVLNVWASTAAFLATLVHQLQPLAQGQIIATCAWGLAALTMLVWGLKGDKRWLQVLGLVVMVVTAAKILLVDLHDIATVWRMVLFMVFGGALLAMSALLPRWQKRAQPDESP